MLLIDAAFIFRYADALRHADYFMLIFRRAMLCMLRQLIAASYSRRHTVGCQRHSAAMPCRAAFALFCCCGLFR